MAISGENSLLLWNSREVPTLLSILWLRPLPINVICA